jgi:phosphatidate cytidylyltransferase
MTVCFIAVVTLDGWLDGSLTASLADDKSIRGTILCALIVLLIIQAQLELAKLAAEKNLKIFTPVSIPASILFASAWYWAQFTEASPHIYLALLSAFTILALFLFQYIYSGTSGVIANCGASCFSIIYLGLLSSFVLAIRIDFGPLPLLMYVFVVKFADIGAYTIGRLFGKHKFSPRISPGKTWEGMAGAAVMAIIIAVIFTTLSDIMVWSEAALFGLVLAFIGQLGDLTESMIKRDVEKKDSAKTVPGFGGILDIVDSPLTAAVFAYLFFMYTAK